MNYPHLFQPIQINSLRFPNRIMYAPIGGGPEGLSQELGTGGAAVYTLGSYQVDEEYSALMGYPNPFPEIKGFNAHTNPRGGKLLKRELLAVKQAGTYCSVELMHAGRYAHNYNDKTKEGYAIGPITESYVHKNGKTIQVLGMDHAMIEHVADNYAIAAKRYINMGFDMVMLHFAHGWLPWQFLSPTFNKRTDEYGGSFENRIRFPLMIIERVRKALGPDVPIELRVGATEFRQGCIPYEEVIRFVQLVEDKIDIVHVSAGLDSEPSVVPLCGGTNLSPHCNKLHWAAEMKQHVHIPVASVGGFITPEEAEDAIASGKCDFVAMAKEAMVDPDWANKAYANRGEDIMPCLRCSVCHGENGDGCAVNPRYARYRELSVSLPKSEHPQKVCIIGGGPAGLRATLFATEAGHQVVLYEKSESLGGIIKQFVQDPYKQDLTNYHRYLLAQMKKHPEIEVHMNTEVSREELIAQKPNAILIAIGAEPVIPDMVGIHQGHVITAIEAFAHPEKIQGAVAIIGSGTTACELGLFVASMHHPVTVIGRSARYLKELNDQNTWKLTFEQERKKYPQFCIETEMAVVKIEKQTILTVQKGAQKVIPANTVIIASGYQPNRNVADQYYGICYKTYKIGDCYRARTLSEATNEAYDRVRNL